MKPTNLNNIPFINPKDLQKNQCPACKGQGSINGKKCDVCGGSGSKNCINIIQDYTLMEKGKPQKKYEITIRDIEEDKILYKNAGYGGIFATTEKIDKFSGKVVEGNYQSAMWGNPLIQRFGIDRLEEQFAKHIEEYVDAMEQAGIFFSDKDKLKKMLIEGNIIKLQKIMGMDINKINNPITQESSLEETDNKSERNKIHAINKISEITNRNNSYAFVIMEKEATKVTIDTISKGLNPKEIIMCSIESSLAMFAHKFKQNLSNPQKVRLALSLLKEIAEDIIKKYK